MTANQSNSPGLLISFDGLDSSGKATQTARLVTRLKHLGHIVHQFQTPDYSTPSGQELKRRLQGKLGDWQNTPWEKKMKYFAQNRAEHRAEVLSALRQGDIVIYDRYIPSSLAFIAVEALEPQATGAFREKIYDAVRREEYTRRGMPKEHVSIFLDIPPRQAAALLAKRKVVLQDEDEYTDRLEVQERLYNEYQIINEQNQQMIRIACVQGMELLAPDAIAELVWEALIVKIPALSSKRRI